MPEDYDRVKRHVAQTVASCPRYLKQTIPDLLRRYETLYCKPLPYRKLGFRSVEEMAARMNDAVELLIDPGTNGVYLSYRYGFSEHIDKYREVIMKDKIPSESTKRIRQMEEELRQSGSGRQELPTYRFQSPPSRSGAPVLPLSDSLLDRLTALVEKHKKVWTTNILQLYRDEYGVELQLKTYGYKDLSELVDILESKRPVDAQRCNLSPCASLVPRQHLAVPQSEIERSLLLLLTEACFAVPQHRLLKCFRQAFPDYSLTAAELPELLRRCNVQYQEVSDSCGGRTRLIFGQALRPEVEAGLASKPLRWVQAFSEERNHCHAYRGHVASLEDFYIIWQEDYEPAMAAERELSACLQASEANGLYTPRSLAIGQPLAFQEPGSNFGWERVEVRALDDRCLRCQSYENGREFELPLPLPVSKVRALPIAFARQPALARHVRLQHLSTRLRVRSAEAVSLFKTAGDRSEEFRVFVGCESTALRPDDPTPVGIEMKLPGALWQDVRAWMHLQLDQKRTAAVPSVGPLTPLPA